MNARILRNTLLITSLAFAVGVTACGSDDDDGDGSGGSAGTSGSAGSSGSSGSSGSGGAAGGGGSGGGSPTDACIGQETAIEADYTYMGETKGIAGWASDCGRANLASVGTPEFTDKVADCLDERTGNALMGECVRCYAIPVECGAQNCLSECLGGDSPECDACTCGTNDDMVNCIQLFDTCSGLPSNTCG